MRVMVLIKANKDSEAGAMPSEQLLADMGNYNEELVKAGILLAGEGLHPSSRGARVRFSGRHALRLGGHHRGGTVDDGLQLFEAPGSDLRGQLPKAIAGHESQPEQDEGDDRVTAYRYAGEKVPHEGSRKDWIRRRYRLQRVTGSRHSLIWKDERSIALPPATRRKTFDPLWWHSR